MLNLIHNVISLDEHCFSCIFKLKTDQQNQSVLVINLIQECNSTSTNTIKVYYGNKLLEQMQTTDKNITIITLKTNKISVIAIQDGVEYKFFKRSNDMDDRFTKNILIVMATIILPIVFLFGVRYVLRRRKFSRCILLQVTPMHSTMQIAAQQL
ncbi:Hypothetical_protein [Hexamita inflata]|uniref:Hypothetical_protein n=1 Tax=Hexamita inflata TaxID=28002 RepID=A0AA86R3J7_9EUKA|nr:Hypothetical protein HINF_LOCUS31143 [Hexamita inflata]CAI9968662.1 Hypothetical protein HINF_LOCUS56307 [Hexamita inflata]